MSSTNFYIDFESDVPEFDDEFKIAAGMRLRGLAVAHHELDHARVGVTKLREGRGPAQFQASVVVYARPGEMAATKKDYRIVEALDEALAEIEQQIHETY
jgi:hypothetical protein